MLQAAGSAGGGSSGAGLHPMGVTIAGLGGDAWKKLLFTVILIVGVVVLSRILRWLSAAVLLGMSKDRRWFWSRQIGKLLATLVLAVGFVGIWFDDPARLATVLGLVGAGLAVALQRVVTAFAAYLIILRGKVFTVGDRITIGGVRGDVVGLGYMQTTVMEMGQPPAAQADPPAMWVQARQYTGRIVRVTNDKIFDSPVYNYTREFPFMWDEIRIPVSYDADHGRAEQVLLDVGRRHTADIVAGARPALAALGERVPLHEEPEIEPRVYYRLTDNWIELTLRFVTPVRGIRALKDGMYRDILGQFQQAGLGIASGTYDIVGLPPIRIASMPDPPPRAS